MLSEDYCAFFVGTKWDLNSCTLEQWTNALPLGPVSLICFKISSDETKGSSFGANPNLKHKISKLTSDFLQVNRPELLTFEHFFLGVIFHMILFWWYHVHNYPSTLNPEKFSSTCLKIILALKFDLNQWLSRSLPVTSWCITLIDTTAKLPRLDFGQTEESKIAIWWKIWVLKILFSNLFCRPNLPSAQCSFDEPVIILIPI